jgi:hypothetical protein
MARNVINIDDEIVDENEELSTKLKVILTKIDHRYFIFVVINRSVHQL